jgi:hypothetical protein
MNLHAVPPLRSTESRDSRIERALSMLTDLMGDEMLPADWRQKLEPRRAELCAYRAPRTLDPAELRNAADFAFWVRQLGEKEWVTKQHLIDFAQAVIDARDP